MPECCSQSSQCSGQHVAGQLHPHENPAAAEADDHGGESNELEHDPVELRCVGVVGLVQDDHPGATKTEIKIVLRTALRR